MLCNEAQELITALVDGELSAGERLAIEAHLKTCGSCRQAYSRENLLKQQIKSAARQMAAPAALRRAVEARFGGKAAIRRATGRAAVGRWFNLTGWRPAFALAILILAVAAVMYTRWPAQNPGVAALATHTSILEGKIALVRSDNPAAMRDELARAVDGRFRPVVLDLSMMNLYPVSGFVQNIGGREVLVTVYQGGGPAVTCFTFLGSEADAPDGAEKFYDADMRLNFFSFSRDGVNGLLHREGDVICVLASRMPAADLLAIIRGKSMHAYDWNDWNYWNDWNVS
jgi:anti-sigma factor (TIGR02949 family)